MLTDVVIWTEKNEIELSKDPNKSLNNFIKYRNDVLLKTHPNDNAQLITKTNFDFAS